MAPAVNTSTRGELDSTIPWLDNAGAAAQAADHWTQLGAKPKAPVSSTPSYKEQWTVARKGKHGVKPPCRPTQTSGCPGEQQIFYPGRAGLPPTRRPPQLFISGV